LRIIVYIDDGFYYFATSALDIFKKELPTRFNVTFQRTSHRYLSTIINQFNQQNLTIHQARYDRSIGTSYLDGS
jgi:hypothetical protein